LTFTIAGIRMTHYAQSQLDLIEVFTWPPLRQPEMQSETTPFADLPKNPAVENRPSTDTSVALNGSVLRDDPALARAAANVARWKKYLPQDCITAMMSGGWHWTT
jgi:hypothetical protein